MRAYGFGRSIVECPSSGLCRACDAVSGRQTYSRPGAEPRSELTALDESGFHFVTTCVAQLEGRGLEEQGLYRVVGVSSKVGLCLL